MSIRAYIKKEIPIYLDKNNSIYKEKDIISYDWRNKTIKLENIDKIKVERYVRNDFEYCFNIWRQPYLLEKLEEYGADKYVNDDFIGEIVLTEESFLNMYENEYFENEEDLKSINKIKDYFLKDGNYILYLECF